MSARLGFAAGLTVGVLAGSRAGRGLYDRTVSVASAVVQDPRVRRGASAAAQRAGNAGACVAGAAVRKVKSRRGNGDDAGGDGDGEQVGEKAKRHSHDSHDSHAARLSAPSVASAPNGASGAKSSATQDSSMQNASADGGAGHAGGTSSATADGGGEHVMAPSVQARPR